MAGRGGSGGRDERGLFDWSGDGLGVGICHFVIVIAIMGAFDVGGGFFVVFDGGGFALAALLRGGEEEAGFYG